MLNHGNGIILIDKPPRMSSARVVARVKRALRAARVGHAGTLDPDATGLLIILINGATRVASYAADGNKVYSGVLKLGVTTTTDDISGEILTRVDLIPSFSAVFEASRKLVGKISQLPPKVSAKKLDGKRAYKLQRSGETFELAPRDVEIVKFDLSQGDATDLMNYTVEVSPGTYVRALARDLGSLLGCGATVVSIRRVSSGFFNVEKAIGLEQVSWDDLRPWSDLVPEMPSLLLANDIARALSNGQRWALEVAWKIWEESRSSVEIAASHVLYREAESGEDLGILKVDPAGGFSFELNIARAVEPPQITK